MAEMVSIRIKRKEGVPMERVAEAQLIAGRDQGRDALEKYTQTKSVGVNR